MSTFLFNEIIFGPVWSRRLGESLGINLLPVGKKVCNFNCIYCECGSNPVTDMQSGFPEPQKVLELLTTKLQEMLNNGDYLDCITFAGNGEPTLHPRFPEILKESMIIRDRIFPKAKIAVLSNATLITNENIFNALIQADLNILKLDSAIAKTHKLINCPSTNYQLSKIIDILKLFHGKLIIQTLFLKGKVNGHSFDNSTDAEVKAWLGVLKEINPTSVMIYSLARDTALNGLEAIGYKKLNAIAELVEQSGIKTLVTP
jgi:wyosine [tRNA(Phe)-imidazoG37] synthetase (radical SAM superfamily)